MPRHSQRPTENCATRSEWPTRSSALFAGCCRASEMSSPGIAVESIAACAWSDLPTMQI